MHGKVVLMDDERHIVLVGGRYCGSPWLLVVGDPPSEIVVGSSDCVGCGEVHLHAWLPWTAVPVLAESYELMQVSATEATYVSCDANMDFLAESYDAGAL